MRAVWPADKPMSVRISAHDWVEGGITPDDAVQIARLFKAAGADMIDCSSGQVSKQEKPVYGRMYQTPFADRIRNEAGIRAIAVGAIFEADHANSIIAAGRADLCAVGRPHLANPAWTLHEAAKHRLHGIAWPKQYLAGKQQLERNLERERQLAAANSRASRRSRSRQTAGGLADEQCQHTGHRHEGRGHERPAARMHALVTGGARGIGRLARGPCWLQGARVTLAGATPGAGRRRRIHAGTGAGRRRHGRAGCQR
jgi:hypothetical protein